MQDQETEKYFRSLNEMFHSEGWQILVNELKANVSNINSVELTKDGDDLMFRKGQLAIISNVINFPVVIEQAQSDFENNTDESD